MILKTSCHQKLSAFLLLTAFGILATSGCHSAGTDATSAKQGQPDVSGPAAAVQTTTYHGVGVVKSTNVKRPSIEIQHEDIPGLMPAMTMEFYVRDKSLLEGMKSGDRIQFTIENGIEGLKVTDVKKM